MRRQTERPNLSKTFLLINKTRKCHCELLLWRLLNALSHNLLSIKGGSWFRVSAQHILTFIVWREIHCAGPALKTVDRMQNIYWFFAIRSKNDDSPGWERQVWNWYSAGAAYKTTLIWVWQQSCHVQQSAAAAAAERQDKVTGIHLRTGIKRKDYYLLFAELSVCKLTVLKTSRWCHSVKSAVSNDASQLIGWWWG